MGGYRGKEKYSLFYKDNKGIFHLKEELKDLPAGQKKIKLLKRLEIIELRTKEYFNDLYAKPRRKMHLVLILNGATKKILN